MSDDGDREAGDLADQLEHLDVDVSDRKQTSDQDEAPTDRKSPEVGDVPSNPREQFERAVEELPDADLCEEKFDAANDRVQGGDSDRGDEESDDESGSMAGVLAAELGGFDPEELPAHEQDSGSIRERSPDETRSESRTLEEALQGMSGSEMRARKFDSDGCSDRTDDSDSAPRSEQSGFDSTEISASEGRGEDTPEKSEYAREFERAMYDVDQMEGSSKYRSRRPPDPSSFFDEPSGRNHEEFITPTLPKSGEGLTDIPTLDDEQRAMLERCEEWKTSNALPELNLRGCSVSEARDRLADFFDRIEAHNPQFCRIVPGRGRQSDGPPVLKPLVLEWLEHRVAGAIRGYAPERQLGGDYGSLVVELNETE